MSFFSPAIAIKSVQQGTIALAALVSSNTATITAVDTAKAFVLWQGVVSALDDISDTNVRLNLTNATTVTATRLSNAIAVTIAFTVVEYS
ncbi:MAG: hypothetical protein HY323_08035 [Betaproteobacteria bacterium]|nr:hypothetical protein [Betaproteobacteria bacterium]